MCRGVVGCVGRNRDEFIDFATAESAALVRTAFLLTGDRGTAEDLVQDVLERLFVAWPRVDDPRAYARRALLNRSRNVWRHRRRHGETPLSAAHDRLVADQASERAERDVVVRGLAALPARQRAALVLRFFDDLSEIETAAAMACSVGAVKTHTSRGLARMRQVLSSADQQSVATTDAGSSL
jgi:RNA polymerase sigma-70 factor (sigma-E family)